MVMSRNMQESYDRMISYDKTLTAYDFSNQVSYIITDEGSVFTIQSSLMFIDGLFLWVISEHENPLIFSIDELFSYSYLNHIAPTEIDAKQ